MIAIGWALRSKSRSDNRYSRPAGGQATPAGAGAGAGASAATALTIVGELELEPALLEDSTERYPWPRDPGVEVSLSISRPHDEWGNRSGRFSDSIMDPAAGVDPLGESSNRTPRSPLHQGGLTR